jgi:hypothetical protein
MKYCKGCDSVKEEGCFYRDMSQKDGHSFYCKDCKNKQQLVWAEANRKKSNLLKIGWSEDNKESVRLSNFIWREHNKDKVKKSVIHWRLNNKDKNYLITRKWLKEHPEKKKIYNSRKHIVQMSTPQGRLRNSMGSYLSRLLRLGKGGRPFSSLVGYTIEELKSHLELNFKDGMSWENRNLWHVDHIIPVSAFNYETADDIDFHKCWALSNLRPMWAKENISKKDKVSIPFQPSLLISGE